MNKKQTHQPQETHHPLLTWATLEFMPTPRGKTWYFAASALLMGLVLYGLLTGGLTMALVFILLAVLFIVIEKREPRAVEVIISDLGIHYKNQFYPYHHINAFWIVYHPPYVRVLYLRIRSGHHLKLLKIELNHQKPQAVRQILLKEIPEIEGANEPVSDILARVLRLQ